MMRRLHFFGIATSLLLSSSSVLAGTIPLPSDVGVTLLASPSQNLVTGDSIAFTITVTNNGPATLGSFAVTGPQISSEFVYPTIAWNDCNLITITGDGANGPFWIPEWDPTGFVGENPIAVGEKRTCHFNLTVASGLPSTFPFGVRLGSLWTDPNSANNFATVILGRVVAPIPALSPLFVAMLMGAIGLSACARLRRK